MTTLDREMSDYLRQARTLSERDVYERTAKHDHDSWTPAEREAHRMPLDWHVGRDGTRVVLSDVLEHLEGEA